MYLAVAAGVAAVAPPPPLPEVAPAADVLGVPDDGCFFPSFSQV